MARTYSKREFLKLMGGLSLGLLPFIGCYDNAGERSAQADIQSPPDKDSTQHEAPVLKFSDDDVLFLTRNDQAYEQLNYGFNKRIHTLPKYIALCRTVLGVQAAIQKAEHEGLPVAVKSGGHSFEGFSTNDGGMVINLSQMKNITWHHPYEVEIQPGCLLQDIHQALFPKQKLLPAGSCGTVGIAGLTLGGGYGFFSRKFGLTCDSLLSFTMVGASGNIYHSDDHNDLRWACKGGGNGNFGVVTSLRFKVYDMPPSFSSHTFKFRNLTAARFGSLLQQYFSIGDQLPADAFGAFVLNGKTLTVLVTNYSSGNPLSDLLAPLIEEADSYSPALHQDLPNAMKRYYGRKGPIYFKNASAGMYRGYATLEPLATQLFETVVDHPGIVFQINTLGGNINNEQFAADSCYPHRSLPYLGELQAYWEASHQEGRLLNAFEQIQSLFYAHGVKAHYRNYPDINFKEWQQAYYGDHYTRLQIIKRKFDPDNLFRYAQSIELS